jgi:polysaccharide biosynthesis/export protein
MRSLAFLTATILPSSFLAWQGANGFDSSSQAALLKANSLEASGGASASEVAPAVRSLATAIDEIPLAIARQGLSPQVRSPLITYPSQSLGTRTPDLQIPNVQRLNIVLAPGMVKQVVTEAVGERSPVFAMGEVESVPVARFSRVLASHSPQPNRAQPNRAQPNRAQPNRAQPNRAQPAVQLAQLSASPSVSAILSPRFSASPRFSPRLASASFGAASESAIESGNAQLPMLPSATPDQIPTPAQAAPGPAPSEPIAPANAGPIIPGNFSSGAVSAGVDEDYILGAGDIIEVIVFNVPEYSGQHRISTNGVINLPLIGRAPVKDLTLNQAADVIAASYIDQLQSPIVTINVLQQRPVQIAIAGEIAQPGLYTLAAQGTAYPRLFEVLLQAGGLTQAADLKNVEVRRQGTNGQLDTLNVDLLALLQEGDISQNIYLRDGDAIVIPSSVTMDRNALTQLSASNLRASSNQPINVAIVGAVTQPGPYQLGEGGAQVTVVQALQQAGGIDPAADLRNVQLQRRTRQGSEQVFDINLWEALQTGDLTQDLALQQGDTLFVPTAANASVEEITALASSSLSTGNISVNIIGEIESPGKLDVRANTSFNQAILAAGGLNRRSRSEATLIRFNANGTVDRQSIDVDLSKEINPETNPILRPNDVIVVGRSARAAFDDNVGDFSRTFNLVWPFLFLF